MGTGVTISGKIFQLLDVPATALKKADGELDKFKFLKDGPTPTEPRPQRPSPKPYATIQRDGAAIATLYESGFLITAGNITPPADLSRGEAGTSLADQRIRQMLALHGGTVVYTQNVQARNAAAQAASLFTAQLAGQAAF